MRRACLGAMACCALLATAGCSLGQGTGSVTSDHLFAHDCWGMPSVGTMPAVGAPYDMLPDFFAAVPYRKTLQIRVQRGTDLTEISDGLEVLIDDLDTIRATIPQDNGADAGATTPTSFRVSVPAGVHPPGSPSVPPPEVVAKPPLVHMSLYLERSCHNQNIVLYSVDGTISFTELFDGNPNETSAQQKLTDATFDVQFGDLRDVPLGGYPRDVPPGLQSRVQGSFRFYFERGQPGQPFP